MTPLLELADISKHYGGVRALERVSLELHRGETHCLIGENGSGKSTLIKIVSGATKPDPGGRIVFDGRDVPSLAPHASIALGVQVIYQDYALFPHLSVAENIAAGAGRSDRGRLVSPRRMKAFAEAITVRLGVALKLEKPVGELPASQRQLVAICRAVAAGGRLLVMDEPTASLTGHEVAGLFRVAEELRQAGVSLLFVSHRLAEVREIAERVTVLRDGRKVAELPAAGLTEARLASLMTGREFANTSRRAPRPSRDILRVEALKRPGEFGDVSFRVGEGEVVGLLGALGAGRTELALTLYGHTRPVSGEMWLCGAPYRPRSVREALDQGVAYLPEDRLTLGLVLQQPIRRNVALSVLRRFTRSGLLRERDLDRRCTWLIRELNIKAPDPQAAVSTLSGGNQQRVAIARLVATQPRLLILDCPTVGVDIAAKDAIYGIVHDLAARGLGVILISDEETEVLHQAHRIIVMRDGRLSGTYSPETTDAALLHEAAHG